MGLSSNLVQSDWTWRLSGKTEKKFSFCCTRRCKLSFSEILHEIEFTWRTVETSDREGPGPHDTLELLDPALLALPLNFFFKCASTLSSFYCSGFSYSEFCGFFFFSCHISRSLTATGIQRFNSIQFSSIQFNSILTLPGVSADPTGWRAQSYNTDLTSDNSCKWGAQTSCPSAKLGDKFRRSHDPSSSITCYNGSQNSGRQFTYAYCFIIKDLAQEEPNRRDA